MCCSSAHGYHYHESSEKTYPEKGEGEYCVCPGIYAEFHTDDPITPENSRKRGECCGAISGADNLCKRCRDHCRPPAKAPATEQHHQMAGV